MVPVKLCLGSLLLLMMQQLMKSQVKMRLTAVQPAKLQRLSAARLESSVDTYTHMQDAECSACEIVATKICCCRKSWHRQHIFVTL